MHKKECDDIKKLFEENDRNVIINMTPTSVPIIPEKLVYV